LRVATAKLKPSRGKQGNQNNLEQDGPNGHLTLLLSRKGNRYFGQIYQEFHPSSSYLLPPSINPYNGNNHPHPSETILAATLSPATSLPALQNKQQPLNEGDLMLNKLHLSAYT